MQDFAQLSSGIDQRPKSTKPTVVTLDTQDAILGIRHDIKKPGDIVIKTPGLYVLIAAPQIGRKSGTKAKFIDFWIRKNGKDIPNSNIRATLRTDESKDVIVNQAMLMLEADDVLNFMMNVESADDGLGLEAINPKGRPTIPSIILSMRLEEEFDSVIAKEIGIKFGSD